VAYVCFIVDAFSRRIVGWRVAGHMRTDMVLDALKMARWSHGSNLESLRCHSDAGSQFTSIRYGERLAELGAVPSTGCYDSALAEATNSLYKAEPIRGARSRTSSWRLSAGSTGSTTTGSTATATTLHPTSSRPPTLPNKPTNARLESNETSLRETQGESQCRNPRNEDLC